MKLRINGNSLRLRLNQEEVAQFSKMGFYEDAIEFGAGARFTYSIECCLRLQSPEVVFKNGSLQVKIPHACGTHWARTDEVGISAQQALESGKELSILIEKDFRCIHRDDGEDPHAYPNPLEDS